MAVVLVFIFLDLLCAPWVKYKQTMSLQAVIAICYVQ